VGRLLEGREADVVAGYEAGGTIDELAVRFGCSARPIRRALIDAGVTFRGSGRRSSAAGREARIAELYVAGATLDELAAEYGCQPRTIRRMLVAQEVTIRPTGRRPDRT
jgi:uncharacterized protein (DUF433 family)